MIAAVDVLLPPHRPRAAFQIRARMRALDLHPTVHVYNELLAVCERNRMWDKVGWCLTSCH